MKCKLFIIIVLICHVLLVTIVLHGKMKRDFLSVSRRLGDLNETKEEKINIVMAVDKNQIAVLPTLLNSIWKNTKHDTNIYVLYVDKNQMLQRDYFSCLLKNTTGKEINLISVNPKDYIEPSLYGHMHRRSKARYTAKDSNYIRFYFHRILPKELHHIIYLDADSVVLGDIRKMWDIGLQHKTMLSAVIQRPIRTDITGKNKMSPANWSITQLGVEINKTIPEINAGIFIMNLDQVHAKEGALMRNLRLWAEGDTKNQWWPFDTQQLMSFTFMDEISPLPERWDILLWGIHNKYFKDFKNPGILHYAGQRKPWTRHKPKYSSIWQKYYVKGCSGKGK